MPQNKSHHFVPQFLLRFFSVNGSSVGLYNLRSGRIVTGASLKHQACRDWFYGRDGKAEHALGQIEGGASSVLRRMIATGLPPKRYSDDHRVLATFLLIQSARTAQAAAAANEMANKVGKLMLRYTLTEPELLAVLDDLTIELTEPAAQALRPALLETPVILDLKIKLLHNVSSTPFVLGDHPAVKHNGLYNGADVSVLGLANLGLQFVMPISPEYAVVLYDEKAYSLGNPASNVVKLPSASIVMALNEFQWANALDNIYFRPGNDPPRWTPDHDRLAELRGNEQVSVWEDEVRLEGTKRAKVINVQTQRPRRALKMPLFRNRMSPPPLVNVGRLPLRDPEWALHVHRMTAALNAGVIPQEEFHVRTMPPQFLRRILRERAGTNAATTG
ncbi:DUF4238 domain-containing protein (plasmid) [Komagataeibacter sucrofermentans]|uniref:DUF4238 domain-containing protein n=2 Tax=Acetobacteraceae TaxID=433 RepID=A0A318QDK6_9PROT|nr:MULTISPECIES: DUF4238 domain-containing protein [Acetobacteraceae]OAG75579.1 hypothetical protein Amal_03240 [Acetobacter malorum]PYD77707.1 hypothetical protein CFR77_14155 [Komagataeibacter sucrofermentans]GBQ45187.1 hypothetical protein AA15973_0534 [Komagataeibacter sucrofermentans DSM 15973]